MNLVLLFLSSDVFFPPILDVPFFCFQKSLIFYYIYIERDRDRDRERDR